MGAGEANSSRRAEVDGCVDAHAKLLSGVEFVDNIGQAKRASHAARVSHLPLSKGKQGADAGIEFGGAQRILIFAIPVIVKAAFDNLKEQRSDRGGAGFGRPLHKVVVQLFNAGAIALAHGGHPVAAMLALGAERKRHGRRMVAAQLGGTDNLRKIAAGELLLPASKRGNAAQQCQRRLHALGGKEILSFAIGKRHVLLNEEGNQRAQCGVFGRDDCNSFIGIFAVIEVASINPPPNARGNGGVFLGFAGVDVLAKADLIALRLKGFD